MMALQLGEREAQLPLDSLMREFSIDKESADGRMLDLIGSALDYVSCLQQGDRLPAEVCSGEASWQPSPSHLLLAATRLQIDVCTWMLPRSRWTQTGRDDLTLLRLAGDPALRDEVHAAAELASEPLGVDGPAEVIARLADLSRELSYIEALRDRLLNPVRILCQHTGEMLRSGKRLTISSDTLSQVHRLMGPAVKQLADRFEELDAQTADIAGMLQDIDIYRRIIRNHRDWLYRNQRAWAPILDRWRESEDLAAKDSGALLTATYHFLAQRFMPATTWHRPRPDRSRGPATAQMAW